MDLALLAALNADRAMRRSAILVTPIDGGPQRLVREAEANASDPLAVEIAARFRSGKSGMVETPQGEVFLTVHVPPPRLVVIGAVHISQALAPMARIAGFDVIIVDPRTAFATPERFAGIDLRPDWPQDVLLDLNIEPFTALAALTHDPKIDDDPIIHALQRGCFYVGALGSRKTHAKRVDRLKAAGVDDAALARIHAPIGLDLGAATPAEIAVAVLAEVIEALRRRPVAAEAAETGAAA